MKILALADYQCDFLAHTILTGLWEVDGVDVYEMPVLNSVRGGVDEGYDLPDGNRGYSGTPSYLLPNPLPAQTHTREEILDLGPAGFDLIVALSGRDYVRRGLLDLERAGWFARGANEKLVLCDGEDSDFIDRDLINRWNPIAFFKRELGNQYSISAYSGAHGRPVMPLPFGAFTRGLPDVDDSVKDYDVFVSLGRTNQVRDRLLAHCLNAIYLEGACDPQRAWLATNNNSPLLTRHSCGDRLHDLLPWGEYMVKQAQAKIGMSVVGFGRDCLHAWELFSYATLAFYQEPGIWIPHPFTPGRHYIPLQEVDFRHLGTQIKNKLRNWDYYKLVAGFGKHHCHQYHSTRARAEYLIEVSRKAMSMQKIDIEGYGL